MADSPKTYEMMDFGPVLMWTYPLNRGVKGEDRNIARSPHDLFSRVAPDENGLAVGLNSCFPGIAAVWQRADRGP